MAQKFNSLPGQLANQARAFNAQNQFQGGNTILGDSQVLPSRGTNPVRFNQNDVNFAAQTAGANAYHGILQGQPAYQPVQTPIVDVAKVSPLGMLQGQAPMTFDNARMGPKMTTMRITTPDGVVHERYAPQQQITPEGHAAELAAGIAANNMKASLTPVGQMQARQEMQSEQMKMANALPMAKADEAASRAYLNNKRGDLYGEQGETEEAKRQATVDLITKKNEYQDMMNLIAGLKADATPEDIRLVHEKADALIASIKAKTADIPAARDTANQKVQNDQQNKELALALNKYGLDIRLWGMMDKSARDRFVAMHPELKQKLMPGQPAPKVTDAPGSPATPTFTPPEGTPGAIGAPGMTGPAGAPAPQQPRMARNKAGEVITFDANRNAWVDAQGNVVK